MASIYKRKNRDGSTTLRVVFRRKGLPSFSTCFNTKREALEFVAHHESDYCLNTEKFIKTMKSINLERRWMREFKIKVNYES